MGFITLDDKQLEKLLIQAYEEGWNGSKELAENSAEEIIKSFKDETKKSKNISEPSYVSWKLENPYKKYLYSTNSGTWATMYTRGTSSTSSSHSYGDLSEY